MSQFVFPPVATDNTGLALEVTQLLNEVHLNAIETSSAAIQVSAAAIDVSTTSIDTSTQAIDVSTASIDTSTQAIDVSTAASAVSLASIDTKVLTDTQLRATPVPVSGPLTDVQLRATAVPVSGPLTDVQLRATAVPVSGPLTDTELRATAVPISASSLPLPTGAATEATVATLLTDTQLRATAVPVSGPLTDTELRATAVPVSGPLTDVQLRAVAVPISASALPLPTGAATEATVATLLTDTQLRATAVPVSASSLPLPTGAATEATVATLLTDTQLRATAVPVSGPLTDAQLRATPVPISGTVSTGGLTDAQLRAVPVPISGTVTATNPSVSATGAAVPASATFIAGSDGTNSIAMKVSATGVVSVDGSAVTQPVSGPLTDVQLRATPVPVSGTVSTGGLTDAQLRATPVPVSGSVTATGPLTDTELRASAVPVSLSSTTITGTVAATQSGTWNINNVSGTVSLPTGASTETTLAALNTKVSANLTVTATRLLVDGSGVTQPVSGTVTAAQVGKAIANAFTRNDYTGVNVTTAAYVQLVASTTSTTSEIEIFDSSGQTLKLAVGAAASEVDQIAIFPGGNGRIPLLIPSGSRVSIRAVSATASVGEIVINWYS